MWFKSDNKGLKALSEELIAHNLAISKLQQQVFTLETNVSSLRGLINRKLGKSDYMGTEHNDEMAVLKEFLQGVPHLAQAEAAQEEHEKSLNPNRYILDNGNSEDI